ncbi:MAG: GCD complex subunit gcd7 [Sclerophora amabilis]|nr:MAG: GCD complex subunit gcd7 [Sclerophora amabilis]
MPSKAVAVSPGLSSYLKSLKTNSVESSIEHLISLLKRRQIRNSRPCAIATAYLLLRVVSLFRWTDIEQLIERIHRVGQRLCAAQPRELAVGNIVRRVLGLIREEAEDDRDVDASQYSDAGNESQDSSPPRPDNPSTERTGLSSSITTFSPLRHSALEPTNSNLFNTDGRTDDEAGSKSEITQTFQRPPLLTSHTSYAVNNTAPTVQSMFSLLTQEGTPSPIPTPPGMQSPNARASLTPQHSFKVSHPRDLKPDIIGGIEEIIDELDQVDDQIAAYALEHIHSNEIIMTHTSSLTVQKFLLKAATKRKFTVIHTESFPNDHEATYATIIGKSNKDEHDELSPESFQKPLISAGITVILIPDSGVFALMSRVNKVILGTHAVLANGGLVAAAGAKTIAKAAQMHKTPVVIVSGVYKLSPVYPFDFEGLIEYGDASKIFKYEDGDLVQKVDVENPLFDYVPAELVDLYITNLGGHAPSYLYRIVSDHYRTEDINL